MPCRNAERAILNLGFVEKKKKGKGGGSSHRQFTKIIDKRLHKVTLDCHKGEVNAKNVRSMIAQAGVTRQAFYEAAYS